MALQEHAPFAPTAAIVRFLETFRETGLGGGPITTAVLTRMSMGGEISRRVLSSLRQLELLDDEGRPTSNLMAFKQAPSTEYKQVLANQLRDVYAPIFAVLPDPGSKSVDEVTDTFRTFKPDSLRKRMVTLFLGLCEYSEIIETSPVRKVAAPSSTKTKDGSIKSRDKPKGGERDPQQTPPPPSTMTARLERYADMLIARAEAADELDPDLADRIERTLGILPAKGGAP